VKNSAGRYWNGAAWVTSAYWFYEITDDATAGYYKPVEKDITIPSATSVTLRFQNKNGNGVLIDSIRFGKLDDPAFRVYITTQPELFLDGAWKLDKTYNLSGFKAYYIQTDMAEILGRIKPAGVYAEMTLLASRLNIPWDRVSLTWESLVKTYWRRRLDATWSLNNGSVYFVNNYLDGSFNLDSEYNLDAKKMQRSTKPTDILIVPPMWRYDRTYKKRFTLQINRPVYLDGRIGLNGKFDLSGQIVGTKVGYTEMKVTKWAQRQLTGNTYLNNAWTLNGSIDMSGAYKYWQNGAESYFVEEVL
jgi:hypothetical protein